MKVTRIAYSKSLNAGKYAQLAEQARRLGRVRSEVWQRFGSVKGVGLSDRKVWDAWMADGTAERFGVLANAWKETVRDAIADITANRAAAKAAIRHRIYRRTSDPAERQRLFTALKCDTWTEDPFLARQMRQHWKRGRNRTHNQIDARAMTSAARPAGDREIGVDKGYSEVLTDSDGQHHGAELGDLLTCESDYRRSSRWRQTVRTTTFRAVHAVVDNAGLIAAEDLTKTFTGRAGRGRDVNRRLAAWTKGVTAEALASVSERRGSVLTLVNAAYTSQVVPCCGALGRRGGDRLHCTRCGVVWQADHAAAINVLHRVGDPDITPRTPYQRVKRIVRERTDRRPDQTADPGLQPTSRAESEPSERSTLITK